MIVEKFQSNEKIIRLKRERLMAERIFIEEALHGVRNESLQMLKSFNFMHILGAYEGYLGA